MNIELMSKKYYCFQNRHLSETSIHLPNCGEENVNKELIEEGNLNIYTKFCISL